MVAEAHPCCELQGKKTELYYDSPSGTRDGCAYEIRYMLMARRFAHDRSALGLAQRFR
jgi:hypothetical protein